MNETKANEREFPRCVSLYENDEELALLKALARQRGVTGMFCCGC
jgi:hypothetical protein